MRRSSEDSVFNESLGDHPKGQPGQQVFLSSRLTSGTTSPLLPKCTPKVKSASDDQPILPCPRIKKGSKEPCGKPRVANCEYCRECKRAVGKAEKEHTAKEVAAAPPPPPPEIDTFDPDKPEHYLAPEKDGLFCDIAKGFAVRHNEEDGSYEALGVYRIDKSSYRDFTLAEHEVALKRGYKCGPAPSDYEKEQRKKVKTEEKEEEQVKVKEEPEEEPKAKKGAPSKSKHLHMTSQAVDDVTMNDTAPKGKQK